MTEERLTRQLENWFAMQACKKSSVRNCEHCWEIVCAEADRINAEAAHAS